MSDRASSCGPLVVCSDASEAALRDTGVAGKFSVAIGTIMLFHSLTWMHCLIDGLFPDVGCLGCIVEDVLGRCSWEPQAGITTS